MYIIEMNSVSKTYTHAARPAVRDVNLNISSGEKLGLIGANGSGKTTLLRLLMNFVIPNRGEIIIGGKKNLERARQSIGFVPERQEGMENFTPSELLRFSAKMYGLSSCRAIERAESLLQFAELTKVAGELLSGFSKGMAQRTQICLALIHNPEILLLDEPMSGLDPGGQKDVREMLIKLPQLTMIYASHNLEEIETFCNVVAIIHEGQIVRKLNLDDIKQEIFTMELDRAGLELVSRFSELTPTILNETDENVQIRFIGDSEAMRKILSALNEQHIGMRRLRSRSVLEDYYHRYVASINES